MKNKIILHFLIIAAITIITSSCQKENTISKETLEVNNFIWQNMNQYYLWSELISTKLNPNNEHDSYKFFDKILYSQIDEWSFITENYLELEKYFSGVFKSTGMSYRLYYSPTNNTNLIGIVEYVHPEGPASNAGIKRGDTFTKINNILLTINNYTDLLNLDEIDITFSEISSSGISTDLSPQIHISSIELETNPIVYSTVINYENKKIGYLLYTAFISDFNDQLIATLTDLKNQNIDELILDLRYNSGGAISSAILMCSALAPQSALGEILIKTKLNDAFEKAYLDYYGENSLTDYLYTIGNDENQTPINLNLNNLYILTTYKTASASELIIYGLSPHMNVITIGEKTHGKYYGSFTLTDENTPKKHNWAIQPIVMKMNNADNSIDYSKKGLEPIYKIEQENYAPLASINDNYISVALEQITGIAPEITKSTNTQLERFPYNQSDEKLNPLKYYMHK